MNTETSGNGGASGTSSSKKDFEVHFIGELSHGSDFGQEYDDGLFVTLVAEAGSDWVPLCTFLDTTQQTQTSYHDQEGNLVWNHPIDFHYATQSLASWPRLRLQVWKVNNEGLVHAVSNATLSLPKDNGNHELSCGSWIPAGGLTEELAGSMLGPKPVLKQLTAIGSAPFRRTGLRTVSAGKLHFNIDVITRHSRYHDIELKQTIH